MKKDFGQIGRLCLLAALLVGLIGGVSAEGGVFDFESGSLGSGWSGDTGDFSVQSGTVAEGDYALEFSYSSDTQRVISNSVSSSSPSSMEFYIWTPANPEFTKMRVRYKDGGSRILQVENQPNTDYMGYCSTDQNVQLFDPAGSSWYHVELNNIDWGNNKVGSILVNGTQQASNVDFCGSRSSPGIDEVETWASTGRGNNGYTGYYDFIRYKENQPPNFDNVETNPSSWTLNSDINVSANISDSDGTVESVTADVYEDGTKIVSDASLSQDADGTWTITDLFTVDESNVHYNISLEATDDDGATSTYETSQLIEDSGPSFNLASPENMTYGDDEVSWELNETEDGDDVPGETLNVEIYEDGQQVGTDTVTEGQTSTGSWTSSDGKHSFEAVVSESDGDSVSKTVDFEVDTGFGDLNITAPQENETTDDLSSIDLNYSISNEPNLDSDSCEYSKDGGTNFSISNCENTSIQFGEVGVHNVTVYASDTLGNSGSDSVEWFADEENIVSAEDSVSGSQIDEFEVLIENSTDSFGRSTSDGSLEFYTSEVPKGDINVTVFADGYQVGEKSLSGVDKSFSQDLSFQLDRAGFQAHVFDEQTGSKLRKPVKVELRNSTESKEVVWGNSYDSSEGGVDNVQAVFDADKSSAASKSNSNYGSSGYNYESASITGFVSLSQGENTIFVDNHLETRSEIQNIQMLKDGAWTNVWGGTGGFVSRSRTTDSFTVNNSDSSFSGAIRLNIQGRYTDDTSYSWEVHEVWANNLEAPSFDYPNYPTGSDVEVTVDDNANDEFRERNYFADLSENSKVNLDAYLLKQGEGILTNVETRDGQNDPLQGSLVNVQRSFEGGYRTVAQGRTGSDGSTGFFLSPDSPYRVVASQSGFDSFSGTFNPANYQYDPLIIRLGEENDFRESTTWDGLEYRLQPELQSLNATGVYDLNWSVVDPENGISSFGVRVKDENGTVVKSDVVSGSPSGGSSTLKFNVSDNGFEGGDDLTVTGFFVKDETEFKFERTYNVIERVEPGLFSVSSLMSDFESGSSSMAQSVVALIFTLVIGSGLKSRFNSAGAGIVSMLVLGVFALQGWIHPLYWMMTALALVGIYSRR